MKKKSPPFKNKTAQVTIFIIIGLLIVTMIVIFVYIIKNGGLGTNEQPETNPVIVFESCLEDDLEKIVETITSQGGYLNNSLNISFQFKESKEIQEISYLCYTYQSYFSCKNQEPLLMNHLEEEIKKGISFQVKNCFDEIASNLGRNGASVEANYRGFYVNLFPGRITISIDGEISSTKSGQTTRQTEIKGNFPSRLYEITKVVQEIVNQEATYCNFDLLGFMLIYPEFEIDKSMTRDSTTIYTVKHDKGVEKFDFAVRSCSFPPAF
jgi:flagellar basal body-associated protein FliL